MTPTTVMVIAMGAIVVGHWANNKPALTAKLVLEMGFAVIVIAGLSESADAYPVAQGFSWLFLAAVLLSSNSPLMGLSKALNRTSPATATPTPGGVQIV